MKFKTKYAALCMAAVLGVTAAPAPVLAEGSYSETEKALLADMIQKLAANYTSEMDDFKILENGVHEDLSLRLEDSGKAILGMVAPADLSWFQDITLSSDLSMAEDVAFMDAGLYVNDTKICSLLYYFDLENMDIYMKVPELRDGFIKMNYDQIMAEEQAALENQDAPDLPEDAQQLQQASLQLSSPSVMRASANIRQFLPDTSVIESLLNRYTTPVFDYTEDTASREETLTVYDVSQDCTFYEGQITGEKAAELAEELLNTAKTDKELEDLLNAWDEQLPDTDNLYQSFLDSVEQGLASLAEESPETDAALTSQIWLNAEGEVTGRALFAESASESTPLLVWQQTEKDDQTGFYLQLGPDTEGITFGGNGQTVNGRLQGTYTLTSEGNPLISAEVSDYDTEAAADGALYGTYKLSLIVPEDDPDSAALAGFALQLDAAAEDNFGTFDLSLTSADIPMAVLSLGVTEGASVEKPELADITETYDFSDEAAVNEYTSGITLDTIHENLTAAGVPEELITQILSGSTEETPAAEEAPAA